MKLEIANQRGESIEPRNTSFYHKKNPGSYFDRADCYDDLFRSHEAFSG